MKIGVLSDTRVPTRRYGGHGLGRAAWDIATGLSKRHDVTLFAGPGSDTDGAFALSVDADETARAGQLQPDHADAWIDLSHSHDLSRIHPDWPVVNWLVDLECQYAPPRLVVGNAWQHRQAPQARVVPLGIDVDKVPMGFGGNQLVYCAKLHHLKGYDIAVEVGRRQSIPVRLAGELFVPPPPGYVGTLDDDTSLWGYLGSSSALLAPSRMDAGGRVILDAAACGTPTLTLDWSGAAAHVEHGVSGYICSSVDELIDAIPDALALSRAGVRAWVKETHDLSLMVAGVESLLMEALDGGTW